MTKTAGQWALVWAMGASLVGAAHAAEPDVGGIRLGMDAQEALKIANNDLQNKVYVDTVKTTLNLTIDGKTGSFDNYTFGPKFSNENKILNFSISPLTNKVWAITKNEYVAGDRPALKAIADAAAKFGKHDPASIKPTGYGQHWMYDKAGKEIEWVNVYDKPRNGNCFESLKDYSIGGGRMRGYLYYPVAPTTACATLYSVSAKSSKQDGLADQFSSFAMDVGAFVDWFKVMDTQRNKALEDEKNRAAKPAL
ncbi:hypothetical protein [Rhodoferax saidenbachensis]|uniref:DUF4412 domain-containing protein n=1 Tax=Rhodoferax saidenbachensis TaxID=1484693 RepID=A0ABU1ZJX9_9BURK|nr:hypothetical protein [Rhodoferax saidenbachensis]MDR7305246.1 hypothetical protein [Rhodoferax saidenbachensis]